MSKEIALISPEGLEIANAYLLYGNIKAVAESMSISQQKVVEHISNREVKRYLDTVYLDLGYRNRDAIGSLMDTMIASKLEEAEESGVYSSKDLLELLQIAHKMRMDEIKAQNDSAKTDQTHIRNQTNVQINDGMPFGQGNYGALMEKLLKEG